MRHDRAAADHIINSFASRRLPRVDRGSAWPHEPVGVQKRDKTKPDFRSILRDSVGVGDPHAISVAYLQYSQITPAKDIHTMRAMAMAKIQGHGDE
jgi:hypothetical protein